MSPRGDGSAQASPTLGFSTSGTGPSVSHFSQFRGFRNHNQDAYGVAAVSYALQPLSCRKSIYSSHTNTRTVKVNRYERGRVTYWSSLTFGMHLRSVSNSLIQVSRCYRICHLPCYCSKARWGETLASRASRCSGPNMVINSKLNRKFQSYSVNG